MVTKKISANVDEHALLELTDEQLAQVTGGDLGISVAASVQVTGLPAVSVPGTGTGLASGLLSQTTGTVLGLLGNL